MNIFEKWVFKKTKKHKEVPLFWVTVDLNKYREQHEGSCQIHVPVEFQKDVYLKTNLSKLIDYVREKYDLEEIVKI